MTAGTYRNPANLAIAVASVDQMSGGRIILGIGTGWYEREHHAFGIPFPPIGERFDRLNEAMQIIHGLWETPHGETFSFDGRFWQLDECANFPALVQQPRPEIVIGGTGPRRTPLMAARYADEFNSGGGKGSRERFENVRRICEEIGRDPATLRMSATYQVICGVDPRRGPAAARATRAARRAHAGQWRRRHPVRGRRRALQELAEQGCETVYLHIFDIDDLDHLR